MQKILPKQPIQKKPAIRKWIQWTFLIATLALGVQFAAYVYQLSGNSAVTVERPPGVEGFLPIGALLGWRFFAATGTWDPIHPAAMIFFGFALVSSFLLRKSFCGWICPVGTISEWLQTLTGTKKRYRLKIPKWIDIPLRSVKYLLLGFFIYVIFTMPMEAIGNFIDSPYYKMSDVKMLYFFTQMSTLTAVVLILLVVASIFSPLFWCRYFCPYGALLGLLAMVGPTRIARNTNHCIECGQCSQECPAQLPVNQKKSIRSPECWGCMQCVGVCPEEGALQMETVTPTRFLRWRHSTLGLVLVLSLALMIYGAKISGHWQSRLPVDEARVLIEAIDSPMMSHPTF